MLLVYQFRDNISFILVCNTIFIHESSHKSRIQFKEPDREIIICLSGRVSIPPFSSIQKNILTVIKCCKNQSKNWIEIGAYFQELPSGIKQNQQESYRIEGNGRKSFLCHLHTIRFYSSFQIFSSCIRTI